MISPSCCPLRPHEPKRPDPPRSSRPPTPTPRPGTRPLCHPEEVRALSIRECALIQEFPCDWEFVGTVQQQYAQVGNAVPTRLGNVAGHLLASYLDGVANDHRAMDHQNEVATSANFRLVYLRSHVRTRKWYKDGETFIWQEQDDNRLTRYAPPVTVRRERPLEREVQLALRL
jgi:DNA (cytosine-5)-methyltransferase 1